MAWWLNSTALFKF